MMPFDPKWVRASKGRIMQQGGGSKENRLGLNPEKVAGR
jgi:hypothetical protein